MKSDNLIQSKNLLDKIDAYYENQPRGLFIFSLVLVVFVVGYLVYDYIYSDSVMYASEQHEKLRKSSEELKTLNEYINTQKTQDTIARLQSELADKKTSLDEVKGNNQFFDAKLKEASRILYNQENWTNFIKKLEISSKKYNINISVVKYTRNDFEMQKIQEAFSVDFDASGTYQNLLKFINALEQSHDVVDIQSITLSTNAQSSALQSNTQNQMMGQNRMNSNVTQALNLSDGANNVSAHILLSIWGLKY